MPQVHAVFQAAAFLSASVFTFYLGEGSRLKIHTAINNIYPGEELDYGRGFGTAQALTSLPLCLLFGCLPCLVEKQYDRLRHANIMC